jgi:hypothetical protein
MKPIPQPALHRVLPFFALPLLAAGPASAQTLLFSDNYNTALLGDGAFNTPSALTADQSGSAATKTYTTVLGGGWDGAYQRGNGGTWLMYAGTSGFGSTSMQGSLNYDIAAAANTLDAPLEIKFNMTVTAGFDPSDWTSFTVGGGQNPFVNSPGVGFSSLFRDSGGTQQFTNGADLGAEPYLNPGPSFADGQLITFVLSDAAETGSAFNSDGPTDVVKMYVNGSLTNTFSGLDLDASDQYISFHAANTVANIDNLAITALAVPNPDYDAWAQSFTPPVGLPAADDDGDGLSNQEEYAFGLLPNSGASVNPVVVPLDKATGSFSYTRRDASLTPLNYSVWFSTDLSLWTEDAAAVEGESVLSGEVETVPVTLSVLPGDPSPDKLFIQVRAD